MATLGFLTRAYSFHILRCADELRPYKYAKSTMGPVLSFLLTTNFVTPPFPQKNSMVSTDVPVAHATNAYSSNTFVNSITFGGR